MATPRRSRLARFLKVVLDILFGVTVFGCVALALWTLIFALIALPEGAAGTASLPVILGTESEPEVRVTFTGTPDDHIRRAFMDEAEVTLWLETRSALLVGVANTAKLVVALGLAFIFHLLRRIVAAVVEGEPFSADNGRRIRRLGFAVLGISVLGPAAQFIAATEILNRLPTTVPPLRAGPTFDALTLLTALFILLLAHIWSYGIELERDRALTV
jgi:hypothetical protein